MKPQNIFVAVAVSLSILIFIFELVRRKKLNEEYSWLWMVTGACLLVLSVFPNLLLRITHIAGAVAPTSVFFFLGLMFLVLIVVHYSTVISKLTNDIKTLSQKLAILEFKQKKHDNTNS